MFCENCGNKLEANHKYCMKCGNSNAHEMPTKSNNHIDQKWWLRLAKVIYILSYLPLLLAIPIVWSANSVSREYVGFGMYGSSYEYHDTIGKAFLVSLLTLVIWVVVLRLIKITFLYISLGEKPRWKKEFSKFF